MNDSAICLKDCNPLGDDCGTNELCVQAQNEFICVPDGSGENPEDGAVFSPCSFANVCDEGLACMPIASAVECDPHIGLAEGCCLPFCDVFAPSPACPGSAQACVAIYPEGVAPAGLEYVGVCQVPPQTETSGASSGGDDDTTG